MLDSQLAISHTSYSIISTSSQDFMKFQEGEGDNLGFDQRKDNQ